MSAPQPSRPGDSGTLAGAHVPAAGGVFIALGSNLGNRELHIRTALRELAAAGDVRVIRCSTLHETAPVGGPEGQGMFLNAVAEIATRLPAAELLERMLEIERLHGRVRGAANGPRTLDLDLLLYRDEAIATERLRVPHPRMWEREFVMTPLREVCEEAQLARYRALAGGG